MLPIMFRLNPTYGLGGDVVWRISRWSPWRPSWISERNNFSNSESLCGSDASHQASVQSSLGFGRRCRLKNFKMAILDISKRNDFNNSESLCLCHSSYQVLAHPSYRLGGDVVWRIWTILAILTLHVATTPPTKFQHNPTYGSGGDVENVTS